MVVVVESRLGTEHLFESRHCSLHLHLTLPGPRGKGKVWSEKLEEYSRWGNVKKERMSSLGLLHSLSSQDQIRLHI
jgi:hypothetical protein